MNIAIAIQIIQALGAFAPHIPEIVTGVQTAIAVLKRGTPPTPQEQADIDALLERAHAELQNAQPAPQP